MLSPTILFIVVQVFMLVGMFGLIIPVFPGLVIIWVAALAYGIIAGFGTAGVVIFIILTLLMLIGSLGDNLLIGATAHQGGTPWRTILLAVVAGLVGTVVIPPIGGLIAAPLVALLLEYKRTGTWQQARQAVFGLATGYGVAYFARVALGLVCMVLWWVWVGFN